MSTQRPHEKAKSSDVLDLMTADDVATTLRVTRKAVYARVARGQLPPPVRLGRRLYFLRVDLIRFLDEKRAVSPERSGR